MLADKIFHLFFPRVCANCKAFVGNEERICSSCIQKIKFLRHGSCISCGRVVAKGRTTCYRCNSIQHVYVSALESVFQYDEHSKSMILALKFSDDISNVKVYAEWMHERGKSILETADLLIPVPLHRLRLFQRKYNQSVLLAREISRRCKIPLQAFVLKKVKDTEPQRTLPANSRTKNVSESFIVTKEHIVRDKVAVLIDDVVTTGATIQVCAKALLDAGAREVRALTLSRTMAYT